MKKGKVKVPITFYCVFLVCSTSLLHRFISNKKTEVGYGQSLRTLYQNCFLLMDFLLNPEVIVTVIF